MTTANDTRQFPEASRPVPPESLGDLRLAIDAVDRALLAAIAERMAVAERIGERKSRLGLPVHALGREAELLERITAPLCAEDAAVVRAAYEVLIAGSRRRQIRPAAERKLAKASQSPAAPSCGLCVTAKLPADEDESDGLVAKLLAALAAGGAAVLELDRANGAVRIRCREDASEALRSEMLVRDLEGLGATVETAGTVESGAGASQDPAQGRTPGAHLLCGLLGRRLSHTLSPEIHNALAAYAYKCFELEPEELAEFFARTPFDGLNVTIPYKQAVMPFCARLTERAKSVGAVNTVVREADGSLTGDNTDYAGFLATVRASGVLDAAGRLDGVKALVLGSGGAAKCVVAVLRDLGAETVTVSRSRPVTYADLPAHADAEILVNATPVGMFPNAGVSPIADLSALSRLRAVLDLIYNPCRTQLMIDAENRGIAAVNGLLMLVVQAVEASRRFMRGVEPLEDGSGIHARLRAEGENIVLTGMPGSGKTTVARILAERLGRELIDLDEVIEREAGRSIPEIFREEGEAAFRDLEEKAARAAGMRRGVVIATGGGTLLRKSNRDALRANGRLVLLTRPLESLPVSGRPVSQARSPERIWEERREIYERSANLTVANVRAPEDAAGEILAAFERLAARGGLA